MKAGASFHQEGPGNVDHLTWVTMSDKGPQIGNIALGGGGIHCITQQQPAAG